MSVPPAVAGGLVGTACVSGRSAAVSTTCVSERSWRQNVARRRSRFMGLPFRSAVGLARPSLANSESRRRLAADVAVFCPSQDARGTALGTNK